MLKQIDELKSIDFYAQNIYAGPQIWKDGDKFEDFLSRPRQSHELVIFCSDASFFYKTDGREICAKRGDVLFIPSKTTYSVSVSKPNAGQEIDSYIVNFLLFDTNGAPLDFEGGITKINDFDGEALSAFKRLSFYCNDICPDKLIINAEFYSLLSAVSAPEGASLKEYYPIKKAVSVLNLEWNKRREMAYYAELCSVSEGYFYKLFKEATGKSPTAYRNEIRINRAKALLLSSDLKIGEIAAYCGFDDNFYFSRVFLKLVGKSPSHFRHDGK